MRDTRSTVQALALTGLSLSLYWSTPAEASGANYRLRQLNQSMQLCLTSASRAGFPYYSRPEAAQTCQQAKEILHRLGQEANRNRNLACSSRIASLDFDLWMIQFIGGKRMQGETSEAIRQVTRSCYNMDTRH